MKRIFFGILLVLLASACSPLRTVERGTLEGQVTFDSAPGASGSAAPAPRPTLSPLDYEKRSLILYRGDGATLVGNVLLDGQGHFRMALDPGTYVVKWRKRAGEQSNLPQTVTIAGGQTTRLDIQVLAANQ